jgi:hypothetical protein
MIWSLLTEVTLAVILFLAPYFIDSVSCFPEKYSGRTVLHTRTKGAMAGKHYPAGISLVFLVICEIVISLTYANWLEQTVYLSGSCTKWRDHFLMRLPWNGTVLIGSNSFRFC